MRIRVTVCQLEPPLVIHENGVAFVSDVCGEAFGENALATTVDMVAEELQLSNRISTSTVCIPGTSMMGRHGMSPWISGALPYTNSVMRLG